MPTGLNYKSWVLVDRTVIAAAVQTYDFAPTVAISGNADLAYWIIGFVVNDNASTGNLGLRANAAAIACNRQQFTASSTTVAAARDTTTTFAALLTTKSCSFNIWIPKAATGNIRQAIVNIAFDSGTAIEYHNYAIDITTPSTATNITSLGLGSDQTTGIGVGSELNLFAIR